MARSYLDKMEEFRFSFGLLEKYRKEGHLGVSVLNTFLNFFRVQYELIEWMKFDKDLQGRAFGGPNGLIQKVIDENVNIQVGLDIANREKHPSFTKGSRLGFQYEFPSTSTSINNCREGLKANTDFMILINNRKRLGSKISKDCMERWEAFFEIHDLNRK